MIQQINQTDGLKKYITHEIEDAGLAVAVDSKLNLDEYIGIKVDDYYMGLHLRGETPNAVDFIVTVDCQWDAYCLYILELKNVKSPKGYTTKDIIEKFETAIDRFIKEDFKEIFLNDKYKYKEIKLYLVTSAYGKALGQKNYQSYIELLRKINQKDTLTNDWTLSNKLFKFQKRILRIEREIPPNPVIKRIT